MNPLRPVAALLAALVAGCSSAASAPPLTAFQRNVGPGSSVTGIPSDGMGTPNGGDTQVPGVSTAGPVNK